MRSVFCSGIFFILFLPAITGQQFNALSAERYRHQIRSALFIPAELPSPDIQVHGKFSPASGVVAERITYSTLFGLRVPAILYLPDPMPAGKIPGIIIVNGHGGDKYSWYSYYSGILFARGGAAVLTYDAIGEGERNINHQSGTRAHDVKLDPPEMGRLMGGLMVTDIMQAVSCLSQREGIDNMRIAATGYSMGSFILSIAGAVDKRIHAVILVGGGNLDGPEGYWDKSKPMCQGTPYRSLAELGDRPAVIYSLHASRGPLLIYNGLQDSVVAVPMLGTHPFFEDLKKRTSQFYGSSKGVFEYGFTTGGHRPYFLTIPVISWMEKQIDFPNWSIKSIKQMPLTLLKDWTSKYSVPMDRGYLRETNRKDYFIAGKDIPSLSRDDLNVFTPDRWEVEKERMVYEKWVEEAGKRVKEGKKGDW